MLAANNRTGPLGRLARCLCSDGGVVMSNVGTAAPNETATIASKKFYNSVRRGIDKAQGQPPSGETGYVLPVSSATNGINLSVSSYSATVRSGSVAQGPRDTNMHDRSSGQGRDRIEECDNCGSPSERWLCARCCYRGVVR